MAKETTQGRPQPTSKDVAALAGVSQSTVSYVMSGKRSIAPETRRRVEAAMKELAYHPNAGARALRGSRTSTIALIVRLGANTDLTETAPYIDTVVDEARQRDFDVVLSTTDDGPTGIERLAGRRVCDAFVLMDVSSHDDRIQTASNLGLPVVLLGRTIDPMGLDSVDFDVRAAAELMVDSLADTGHRHIVVLGEDPDFDETEYTFVADFWSGARDRAERHGIQLQIVRRPLAGWAGITAVADQILAHRSDRLGIIVRSPQATDWMLQLLRVHSLVPGEHVSVLSLCTDENATRFDPPVGNISPEPRSVSRRAMQVLFDRLSGDDGGARFELVKPSHVTARTTVIDFR